MTRAEPPVIRRNPVPSFRFRPYTTSAIFGGHFLKFRAKTRITEKTPRASPTIMIGKPKAPSTMFSFFWGWVSCGKNQPVEQLQKYPLQPPLLLQKYRTELMNRRWCELV